MPNYHHLLLATEFSEPDLQIAQKARDIADQNHANLSLVHILDNIPMPDTQYGTIIPLDRVSNDPLLEAEKTKLNKFAELFDIPLNCRWLIWGIPKQEVIPIAETQQVDLIVVGCHSRHGLALLFDSTADGLLHRANCDILAVRLPTS